MKLFDNYSLRTELQKTSCCKDLLLSVLNGSYCTDSTDHVGFAHEKLSST